MSAENLSLTEMLAVEIDEFVSGAAMPVNVYLKLGNDKFVLLAQKGDNSQLNQLALVNSKSVSTVYVRKEDYKDFSNSTVSIVKLATKSGKFSSSHKAKFLRSATNAVFTQIANFGASEEAINHAKDIANSTIDMIEPNTTIAQILNDLKNSHILNQSIAVSSFSVMTANILGWQSRAVLEKISLGALLAEVGLKELPPELANKPRSLMTYDEIALYEEHPYRGLKLLESAGSIPDDVKSIVFEHHENSMGLGYPRKLRDLRMNPLAKVVSLSTQFCELILPSPTQPDPISPIHAAKYIQEVMGQPFNKEAFRALCKLIEIDVKKKKIS